MNAHTPQETTNDTMDRAYAIYDRVIRPTLEFQNSARIVSIDVDSEDFEIDGSALPASMRLLFRKPDARIGAIRIGVGPVHRLGLRHVRKLS